MNITLLPRMLMLSLILVLTGCGGGGGSGSDNDDSYSGLDSDSDGVNDANDSDDDNDGVADADDAFPLNETETLDTDGDGTGNNADSDDDNDGAADADDAFPLDETETLDTDSDGIGNNADIDDDGDGVADADDACPLDATGSTDTDGDGVCDTATSAVVQSQALSSGVISSFGSIYINGVKYETTDAEFVNGDLDDLPNAEQDLEVGDVIWIRGTINDDGVTGVAQTVIFDVDLVGTVGAINPAAGTVTVLGRTVHVNNDTVFGNNFSVAELSDIALNDVLDISGFDQADGSLLATRIDKDISGSVVQYKVEGVVTAVSAATSTLNIGTQQINYTGINNGFSATVNQWIEVRGALDNSGVLVASYIEVESRQGDYGLSGGYVTDDLAADTEISLEGVVTEYTDASHFSINGYAIQADSDTLYIGGDDTDIALEARLSVRGVRSDDGSTLLASKAYVRAPSNLEVEGLITAIDTLASTVEVAGVTVLIQSTSQLEDETGIYRKLSIAQLAIGDYVDVSGQFDGTQLIAYRLERDSGDNDLDDFVGAGTTINGVAYYADDDGYLRNEAGEYHTDNDGNYSDYQDTDDYRNYSDSDRSGLKLEGIATQISQSSVTLYGNQIAFTAATVFELNDRLVTVSSFLAAASASPYVSVRTTQLADGTLQALKIELEHASGDYSSSGDDSDSGSSGDDQLSVYDFVIKGAITAIDANGISLNNGYSLIFNASTLYETYALVSQAQFINDASALINPVVEIKALRNSAGQLVVIKVELESSDSQYDGDEQSSSERELEGYGTINSTGVTIRGVRVEFTATTYFELYDRSVSKATFLAAVSGSDKFEVKTRVNAAGVYEALKVELDD